MDIILCSILYLNVLDSLAFIKGNETSPYIINSIARLLNLCVIVLYMFLQYLEGPFLYRGTVFFAFRMERSMLTDRLQSLYQRRILPRLVEVLLLL